MNTITEQTLGELAERLRYEERSEATVEKYLRGVRSFAVWLGERALTREAAGGWKQWLLEQGLAPETVNGKLSALNALLRLLGREDCRVRTLRVQRRVFRAAARELTREDYERLVATATRQKKTRLALVLETLCASGMRVSELRCITVEALRGRQLVIRQKGKFRRALLPGKLVRKLKEYAREQGVRSGPVFVTGSGRALSRGQIWAEMKAVCAAAGVEKSKVFPHNLRHLFAREYYRLHHDIVKLADLLGHSSVNTTRIYLIDTGEEHQRQLDQMELVS